MTSKFDAYDILGIIVPGTLLLGWFALCFPEAVTAAPQLPYPEAFAVVLLTALSIFLGQIIQAVASLLEPALYWTWGGRPSDVALQQGLRRYLPAEAAGRVKKKLQRAVGPEAEGHVLFLYAMQRTEGSDVGRVRRFNSLYAYHRALLVLGVVATFMFLGTIVWGWGAGWTWQVKIAVGIGFLLFLSLIWYRAWQRACYYVREVLLTAEPLLDDDEKKKE